MADFQETLSEFNARQAQIIAFSVDSKEDAQESVSSLGLQYPVAYGLDHIAFARATGAFYEVRRNIIHVTEFLLNPDGTILGSVYSSGPSGRYSAKEVLRVIDSAISQAAKKG